MDDSQNPEKLLRSVLIPVVVSGDHSVQFLTPRETDGFEEFEDIAVEDREYDFVREYSFTRTDCDQNRDLFITLQPEKGLATFTPISSRTEFRKRPSRKAGEYYIAAVQKPVAIDQPSEYSEEMDTRRMLLQPRTLLDEDGEVQIQSSPRRSSSIYDDEDDEDNETVQRDIFGSDSD